MVEGDGQLHNVVLTSTHMPWHEQAHTYRYKYSQEVVCTPLIPALRIQLRADASVRGREPKSSAFAT